MNLTPKILLSLFSTGTLALSGVAVTNAAANPTASLHDLGMHWPGRGHHVGFSNNNDLANFLKLSPTDLRAQLKSGKTLEQVAAAQGISADQLKQFFTNEHSKMQSAMKQHLQDEVTSGKITQQQMDTMLQKMANRHNQPGDWMGRHMGRTAPSFNKLAVFLGISTSDLQNALKSGTKLQDIAAAHGKTTADLKAFFDQQAEDRLNQLKQKLAVEVQSGKITQQQMDNILQRISEHQGKRGLSGFQHNKLPTTNTSAQQ